MFALRTIRQLKPHALFNRSHGNPIRVLSSEVSVAKLIQQLRKQTGAPMTDCKKALNESDNDYEKATDWLRKNSSAKAASKLVGRDASEGLVGISIQKKIASIVRVSSETDFASRSTDFSGFVEKVAEAALQTTNMDDLIKIKVGKDSVKDALDDAVLAIRENLQIARVDSIRATSDNSVLAGYVHGKVFQETQAGTSAAIVELESFESKLNPSEIAEVGKKLAMHIVAARPTYLAPENVPADIVEKEKEILMEELASSGKPPEILEKIVGGRLRKFYENICLTEQGHMLEEGNPSVSKSLKAVGLKVVNYKCDFIQ
jgi:elongation factor Ts